MGQTGAGSFTVRLPGLLEPRRASQGCIADTSAPAGLAPAKATGLRAELKPAEGKQQRQELTQQPAEALAFLS